jgi:hypothetical protein
MSHRKPGSDTWELAVRNKQLWEELVAEVYSQGDGGARERLGWMRTGITILQLFWCLCLAVLVIDQLLMV